jgi:hypothetical protein
MSAHVLFLISGGAFLIFLLAALELSRGIRKKSGDWQKLEQEAEQETNPLMEVEQEVAEAPAARPSAGKLEKLNLPRAPEIIDQILTHTDWDGMISGALIKNFSPLAKVEVSTPRALKTNLRKIARSPDKPNRLFISDIGIGSAYLADIEDALIDIQKSGTKIYWYDHHRWSPLSVDTARRDCEDLIVDIKFRNAAEIIYERIVRGNDYAAQLIRLLRNKLKPEEEEWGENWRRLILATQSSGTISDIVELIGNLAADRSFSVTDKFRISRMADEEKIFQRFAEGKHREEVTQSGLKFLVVDLRIFRMEYDAGGNLKRKFDRHTPPASIGYDIAQYHKPDFYILVLKNDRLSIRGGMERKFRIDPLRSLKSIAGKPVQIAGHTYAAGVYLTVGLKSKLKYIWNWALPQEVEDFIGEVKKRL